VLALLLVVFVGVIYGGARNVLLASAADRVREVSQELQRELQALNASNPFGAVPVRTSLANQDFLNGFSGSGLFIEAYNQYGRPIGKSANLGTRDIPTQLIALDQPRLFGAGEDGGLATNEDGRLLVNRVILRSGGQTEATVYIAESLTTTDTILKRFRGFLVVGLVVALAFIALASTSLARAALGPIAQIARAAREISGEDLGKRLNWTGRADELGALATTFDEMLARLESAFARERRFIADASHELKTPLTVINANSQMLARWGARNPEIMAEALRTIEMESATMARVINAMLTLAKTDDPKALALESVDFARVVHEVGLAMQPAAQAKGLMLLVDVDDDLAAWVQGEPGLLRQLVTNLTENAIKFTQSGSITLSLHACDRIVELRVRDTGAGIPSDALPHIFERFYRADPARSRNVDGTGLGLAVVNNIVRVHGGRIGVASEPGAGTTFTVDLPLESPPQPSPKAA
jgi:two-component system OmpR family sensor kinase